MTHSYGSYRAEVVKAPYHLPLWDLFKEKEDSDHVWTILHGSVCKCTENTYLVDQRCKGMQHRRPVVDTNLNLTYWDAKCKHFGNPRKCPEGMKCQFAHTELEVSLHPAVYKSAVCPMPDHTAESCCYAHSEEDMRLFAREYSLEMAVPDSQPPPSDEYDWNTFLMYKFKTQWCPIQHVHNWSSCVFAHHYGDMRRDPRVKYGTQPCPHAKDTSQMTETNYLSLCPDGFRCPFAHNAKERVYHPIFYRTVPCKFKNGVGCPMGRFCTFSHGKAQDFVRPASAVNYKALLPEKNLRYVQRDMYRFPGKPHNFFLATQVEKAKFEYTGCSEDEEVKRSRPRRKRGKKSRGSLSTTASSQKVSVSDTPDTDSGVWTPPDLPEWFDYAVCSPIAEHLPRRGLWGDGGIMPVLDEPIDQKPEGRKSCDLEPLLSASLFKFLELTPCAKSPESPCFGLA